MSGETFADLWALAGAAAAREFDPDGLPIWGWHPEHGWHHASESATALAEEAWMYPRADGSRFRLPEFDAWLSALPMCPMKEELLRRRALAAEIVAAPGEYDRAMLLRHLVVMEERWRMDVREQALLPLARTGHDHKQEQRRRASKSRTPPEVNSCIEAALAKQGTAKERWAHLLGLLEASFTVREVQTQAGGLAVVIDDAADRPYTLSLKTFQNRSGRKKSRQPG